MRPGTRFLLSWYGQAVGWDFVCPEEETASHAAARLLANRWTRWPVTVLILGTVIHLFAMAHQMNQGDK